MTQPADYGGIMRGDPSKTARADLGKFVFSKDRDSDAL
jgi:hypothetical protein